MIDPLDMSMQNKVYALELFSKATEDHLHEVSRTLGKSISPKLELVMALD